MTGRRYTNVYADNQTAEAAVEDFLARADGLDSSFEWNQPDDCDCEPGDKPYRYLDVYADSEVAEAALVAFVERSACLDWDGWEEIEEEDDDCGVPSDHQNLPRLPRPPPLR